MSKIKAMIDDHHNYTEMFQQIQDQMEKIKNKDHGLVLEGQAMSRIFEIDSYLSKLSTSKI